VRGGDIDKNGVLWGSGSNGTAAWVSEQRVVERLGYPLTDPCWFDILQSAPGCGTEWAATQNNLGKLQR
jgi:hypothetical protein